ncbi:group III truncated hemoglobin [Pedobacter hiemivivus]|uniref:Group III truncated hemoglobin n=1 Tax=Pedobacter hiemivivus TaxID=2530454 RepID=A0A4U1GDC2_9SPHI|nr:group III truncated hemoglobin [Pedobacter hiemivivus]TKC62017.1 group III truncated hemoglobin [Pedobacter hiemivivus]
MEAKHDIIDLNDIIKLVNGFYAKVQHDELIGPIFNDVIKEWEPHLQKMYAFWNAVLFGVPGFTGNPFARHAPLPIEQAHFDRWLVLFNETVGTLFAGEVADQAKKKAETMALMFLSKLQHMRGCPAKVIV